jgi:beta-galactosidase
VAHLFVDGDLQASSQLPLIEDRGAIDDITSGFTQSFSLILTQGTHPLSILTCSLGLIKGDWMLGVHNMVEEREGFWGQALWNAECIPGPCSASPGLVGERGTLFANCGALVPRQENWQEAVGCPLRWGQLHFPRTQADHSLVVDLSGMRKGVARLNGRCIGRYWLTPETNELPD